MSSLEIKDVFEMYRSFQNDCKTILGIHNRYTSLLSDMFTIQNEQKRQRNIEIENKNVRRTYTRRPPNAYTPITRQPSSINSPFHIFRRDRKHNYRSPLQSPLVNNLVERKHRPASTLHTSVDYILNYNNLLSIFDRKYLGSLNNNRASTSTNTVVMNDNEMTSVIVRPSSQQIKDATSVFLFKDVKEPISHVCPIDKDAFLETDEVMIINHCKHVFRKTNLEKWFEENVTCPLCRYDIREYSNILNSTIGSEHEAEEIIIEDFN